MNDEKYFQAAMKSVRMLIRQNYTNSWTPEEASTYGTLDPKQQRRYDRRVHRWLDGKIDGPMPLIPGTNRSTRPSSDANCTEEHLTSTP